MSKRWSNQHQICSFFSSIVQGNGYRKLLIFADYRHCGTF